MLVVSMPPSGSVSLKVNVSPAAGLRLSTVSVPASSTSSTVTVTATLTLRRLDPLWTSVATTAELVDVVASGVLRRLVVGRFGEGDDAIGADGEVAPVRACERPGHAALLVAGVVVRQVHHNVVVVRVVLIEGYRRFGSPGELRRPRSRPSPSTTTAYSVNFWSVASSSVARTMMV